MQNKPINSILKEHFNVLYEITSKKAKKDFKANILDKILNLEDFDKINHLITEQKKIKDLIVKSEHPYYIYNHNSVNKLFTQFSNRFYLLNIDESEELKDSIYLGAIEDLMKIKIQELKAKIPKFTFNDFISGKECKYFNAFENQFNIENQDLFRIINWRKDNLTNLVTCEVELLVKKYQVYCSTITNPLDFINEQIQIIEKQLIESISDVRELKRILSKLFVFKDIDMESYDDELLLYNYPKFFNDRIDFGGFNPLKVNQVLNKKKTQFSSEYLVFYTLKAFLFWLKDILNEESIKKPFKYPIWEDLLNEVLNEAEQEVESVKVEINNFSYNPFKRKKVIRKYLRDIFEKQISMYYEFEDMNLYKLLKYEDVNMLIPDFKIKVLCNNNKEKYLKKLKDAYILKNISFEISNIYSHIFETNTMYPKGDITSFVTIRGLINGMLIDKNTHNELQETFKVYDDFHIANLSKDIHQYNCEKKYSILFEISLLRLQSVFSDLESNNKTFYIQNRLKELRVRELRYKMLKDDDETLKSKENKYIEYFKEILDAEQNYIEIIKSTEPITLPASFKKPEKIKNTYHSFKYIHFDKNQEAIADLKDSLVKNKFIAVNTKLTDFKKIFSGDEIINKINWTGNISELACFIKNLINDEKKIDSLKQNHWEVTIKCFLMSDGSVLNKQKLRQAKAPASTQIILKTLKNF